MNDLIQAESRTCHVYCETVDISVVASGAFKLLSTESDRCCSLLEHILSFLTVDPPMYQSDFHSINWLVCLDLPEVLHISQRSVRIAYLHYEKQITVLCYVVQDIYRWRLP